MSKNDSFELWCWRRLLRVPWTARRSNQSILKEVSPEYSLEGLMLKQKLQYFGYLLQRTAAAAAMSLQSCPTLRDPIDGSLPGSSVCGIFQAGVLEWVAISFSRGIFPTQGLNLCLPHYRETLYCLSYQRSLKSISESESQSLSCVQLFPTPYTVEFSRHSMEFSRPEYWSG